MSIEKLRSSLNSDDIREFDKVLSNFHMANNVSHEVIDFDDAHNFVVKSSFNTKPYIGIVLFQDGNISVAIWYLPIGML